MWKKLRESKRHCCKNCHFLAKEVNDSGGIRRLAWSNQERTSLQVKDHYAANCHRGVWDTGIDPSLNSHLSNILLQDRKNQCFFIEVHEGMSYPAAIELQRIKNDNRQLRQSYKYTQIALWIAAFSATVGAAGVVANYFKGP